jgi:hypothetical protein
VPGIAKWMRIIEQGRVSDVGPVPGKTLRRLLPRPAPG